MKKKMLFSCLTLLFLFQLTSPASSSAASVFEKVNDAATVFREVMSIPEHEIPPSLLHRAHAIAIIPGLIKAGFIVGGRYGTGVLMVRGPNGWSNPAFITLGGGSVGWQIGAQSTDIILVFKSAQSVNAVAQGKFTLGADASVAAGPVGRHAEAGTDIKLDAEIYSYSRSRGLFAGVALEGAALQMDNDASAEFYRQRGITAQDIFAAKKLKAPAAAGNLRKVMDRYTGQAPKKGRR